MNLFLFLFYFYCDTWVLTTERGKKWIGTMNSECCLQICRREKQKMSDVLFYFSFDGIHIRYDCELVGNVFTSIKNVMHEWENDYDGTSRTRTLTYYIQWSHFIAWTIWNGQNHIVYIRYILNILNWITVAWHACVYIYILYKSGMISCLSTPKSNSI